MDAAFFNFPWTCSLLFITLWNWCDILVQFEHWICSRVMCQCQNFEKIECWKTFMCKHMRKQVYLQPQQLVSSGMFLSHISPVCICYKETNQKIWSSLWKQVWLCTNQIYQTFTDRLFRMSFGNPTLSVSVTLLKKLKKKTRGLFIFCLQITIDNFAFKMKYQL